MNVSEISIGQRVTVASHGPRMRKPKSGTVYGFGCDWKQCTNTDCIRVLWDGNSQTSQTPAAELIAVPA